MGVGYNPKVVSSGLVGYWDSANPKSYPGTGTTWYDLAGNNDNLAMTNLSFANGLFTFNSANNTYATITNPTPLQATTAATLSAFIYSSSISSQQMIIDYQSGSPYYGYNIFLNGSKFYGEFAYNVNAKDVTPTQTLLSNTWYYVASTYDSSTIKTYVNCVLDGNVAATGTMTYTSMDFRIGKRQNAETFKFNGYIACPMVYNRALSLAEITQNFNATRGRFGI